MSQYNVDRIIETDVLVVGGGGAAARAALSSVEAGAEVRVAVKSKWLGGGSTATAFSELLAIAAAIGHGDERDHPEIHYEDTLDAGKGFIDPELVWTLASEVPDRIKDLIDIGLNFDKQENGKLVQGMSDFATYPRTCRVNGVTARHILVALSKQIKKNGVPIDEQMSVFKLVTDENKNISGALAVNHETNELILYKAPSVILACGGAQHVYKYAVGTAEMVGNGYAMAYELGVPLINMEFIQIGPGAIKPSITLLSGPVWKTKPILKNNKGEEIFSKHVPSHIDIDNVYKKKVFPFTISSDAYYFDTSIQKEMEANPAPNGGVWANLPPGSEKIVEQKIPKTSGVLKAKGIDILKDKFEVALIAQCMNGGALIESPDGTTKVPGLFIAGETAGGLRGPDRPGGNSLAEGQVFGHRTGKAAAAYAKQQIQTSDVESKAKTLLAEVFDWIKMSTGTKNLNEASKNLKDNMYKNCLIIRNEKRLNEALELINDLEKDLESGEFKLGEEDFAAAIDFKHMLITAKSIVISAQARKESRSCHFREDYPEKDDSNWIKSIYVVNENNEMKLKTKNWPGQRKEKRNEVNI
ncbi:FAD-binding protein [Metabacillus idriensis]|uniref:FAD-binding protein n=1 Tax=Metabacillus idriensis TaxID=324768 RepID=A0A6I2MLX1_9BACI|nr:FAD-binding protein [Metabacillus idriensis]MCM3598039.1 FAD-binding protein [Metabacillus idriensis]MRX56853.1 FAD-binding protein [Metabacillus idriensis]